MPKPVYFLAAPLLALQLVTAPLRADEAPDASTVVATVNGTDITLGHIITLVSDLPDEYQALPGDVLLRGVLDQMISQTLLQQSLNGAEPYSVTLALENQRRNLLAVAAVTELFSDPVTEAQIKAEYDRKYADMDEKEFHASHILVETEDAAKQLITELEAGAEFAALARQHSTGPSGPSGGDLGWFGEGRMVPAFEAAVVGLEPGQVSAPVETQFGWHVILLHDTRIAAAPPLDAVQDVIAEELRNKKLEDHIEALRAQAVVNEATIDENGESRFDPDIVKDTSLLEQ